MIPLYGFLEGDTLGLLILADEEDTTAALADRLEASAAIRVGACPRRRVIWRGRVLDRASTVGSLGMQPLDRFDVVSASEEGR
jgi:hypothetical protein